MMTTSISSKESGPSSACVGTAPTGGADNKKYKKQRTSIDDIEYWNVDNGDESSVEG